MAPHQSGFVNTPNGVDGISMHHDDDWASGNKMGNTATTSSDVGDGLLEAHGTASFKNELKTFLKAFTGNNNKVNQQTIDDFIKLAKEEYNITVKLGK